MNPILGNAIIILILIAMVAGAIRAIYKEKKKGHPCIGCPMAGKCTKFNKCKKKE